MKDGMLWKVLLVLLGIMTGGLFLVAYIIFKNSYGRKDSDKNMALPGPEWAKEYHERYIAGCLWNRDVPGQTWYLTSRDGLTLEAKFVPAKGEAVRNIILAHGYQSVYYKDFSEIAQWYVENGANILFISQRASIGSGGKYLTMGIRESEDLADWAMMMDRKTGGKLPMYFHGISMGAATVMMAQGEALPVNMRGIIADCGFTSPWDISVAGSRQWYPWLPAKLLGSAVGLYCHTKAGFWLREKNTVDILKKAKVPTLFIHGMMDDFVPPHMTVKNYQACAAPKSLMMSEEATHALSWFYDTEKYKKAVLEFIAEQEEK